MGFEFFGNVILFLKGPKLLGGNCVHGRMVPMPDGYGAILLGKNNEKWNDNNDKNKHSLRMQSSKGHNI